MELLLKKRIIVGASLAFFFVLSALFCYPSFQGKVLYQGDIKHGRGDGAEIAKYREQGEQILWTNALLSGMPTNLISVKYKGELLQYIHKLFLLIPFPANLLFKLMLGYYILLLALKMDLRLATIGAAVYGLSSLYLVYLAAGHNTKINALTYLPGMLAGLLWLYRHQKKYLGASIFMLFAALSIQARHPQMLYYMSFVLFFYWIYEALRYFSKKQHAKFIKITGILLLCLIVAVGASSAYLINTANYAATSVRGKAALKVEEEEKISNGLSKDYINEWSFGISETFSLLIPNFKGESSQPLGSTAKVTPELAKHPTYWGNQPSTSGAVYAGALMLFLAIIGVLLGTDKIKYVFLIGILWSLVLSYGKNCEGITSLFIEYFPWYNKFRAPVSWLVILLMLLPILGLFGLEKLLHPDTWNDKTTLFKKSFPNDKIIRWSFITIAGFCLLNAILPGIMNTFLSDYEEQFLAQKLIKRGYQIKEAYTYIENLIAIRENILRVDALRSFTIIGLGGAILWWFAKKKWKPSYKLLIIGVILIADVCSVGQRYLNKNNYRNNRALKENYGVKLTPADQKILADNDPHYRVLNATISPFSESVASFFHKSITGYHPAKLRVYQDLIDYYLNDEIDAIRKNSAMADSLLQRLLKESPVVNLLNTKYVIKDDNAIIKNKNALGNAFFVEQLQTVSSKREEMQQLKKVDLAKTAITTLLNPAQFNIDSSAIIKLTSYHPKEMSYASKNGEEGFVVFSEIYHPNWKAYINQKEVDVIKVDYLLRGLKIPAGNHKIVFKYIDQAYQLTGIFSYIFSVLILLGVPILLYLHFKYHHS